MDLNTFTVIKAEFNKSRALKNDLFSHELISGAFQFFANYVPKSIARSNTCSSYFRKTRFLAVSEECVLM